MCHNLVQPSILGRRSTIATYKLPRGAAHGSRSQVSTPTSLARIHASRRYGSGIPRPRPCQPEARPPNARVTQNSEKHPR
jgi:hypothetical protein